MRAKSSTVNSSKILLPLLAIIFFISVYFIIKVQDDNQVEITRTEVSNLLEGVYSEQRNAFNDFLNRQFRHLTFLLETPPIQGIGRAQVNKGIDTLDGTTTATWANRLSLIFTSLASNYKDISQVRLIDASTGYELVRVDKIGQDIQRVVAAKLQHKGNTDYFKKTLKLPEHTIYISELDLNRENGAIEYPVKPTIRFSIPVYNQLNQMYSMAYGTLPIVREVGGLKDSVIDYDTDSENATGFSFKKPDPIELLLVLMRSLLLYSQDLNEVKRVQLHAMTQNFSWDEAADKYLKMYLS